MRTKTARKPRPADLSTRGIGSLPLSYYVVIAICGCIIAAGFLFAARQHFVSMDLGMKNSKLRNQLEDVETENRRLTLAREVALSPTELTRTARGLGFVAVGETELPVAVPQVVTASTKKAVEIAQVESKTKGEPTGLTHTAFQRPAGASIVKAELTSGARKNEKTEVKVEGVRPRIVKPDVAAVAKLR